MGYGPIYDWSCQLIEKSTKNDKDLATKTIAHEEKCPVRCHELTNCGDCLSSNGSEGKADFFKGIFTRAIKVRKSRKQFMLSLILPQNEQKITILSIFSLENTHDSGILFIFGRIENTIICFRDCLTFSFFLLHQSTV